MTFAPGFGVLLRGFRRDAALTQEALAARAGLSAEAIRVLEAGRRRHPRPSTIDQLAVALGLSDLDRSRLVAAARRRPESVFHDLPADIDDFTGRSGDLEELLASLDGTATAVSLVSVAGMGGIGKTALAVHGARLMSDTFPDGCLFLNLRGHGGGRPPQPLELVQRLLGALGVDQADIPADLEPAAARYRTALAGRKILVLLDDAADSAQVVPLIPGTAGSAALITSRRQLTGLAGARQLRLDVLPDEDALELLSAILGNGPVELEPTAALAVIRLCGHLPLALRIAVGYLSSQRGKTLGQLAAELESSRPEVLSADGGGVRASIGLSLRALTDDPRPIARIAAELLGVAALLGVDDFALRAAAAAAGRSAGEVEDALEHLVDVSLLETPQLHRYRMHDLIKEVGRELADGTLGVAGIAAVRQRVLDHYLALAWRIDEHAAPREAFGEWSDPAWSAAAAELDLETATELLDADRQNLVAAVLTAADGSEDERLTAFRIAAGLNTYGMSRKRWSEWRAILEAAVGAVRVDEPGVRGLAHLDLGLVLDELEDYKLAADELSEAARCAREIGMVELEATALMNLSHALERTNRLTEARAVVGQARDLRSEAGFASWGELVLGMIAGKENDLAGQRAAFERSIELYRAAGADRRAMALRHRTIGEALAEVGAYDEAEAAYLEALAGFRESSSEVSIAGTLECLGSAYVGSGRLDEAEKVLTEGLVLARAQQQWDCEARIRVALGRRLAALGQPAEAGEAWRQALGIYEHHGAAAAEDVRELLA